jgi:hypothetical protein
MYECETLNRPRTSRLSQLVSKRNSAKALEVQQSLQKLVLYDFTTETYRFSLSTSERLQRRLGGNRASWMSEEHSPSHDWYVVVQFRPPGM